MKIEGDQSIPSALLKIYKATLTEKNLNTFCKKRSPFRIKKMQEGGSHVRLSQINQRERFKKAIQQFNQTGYVERQRWYASRPIWNSFLWYYDYFMLSAITGVLGASAMGAAVIKSIQVVKGSVPTTGGKSFVISAIDANKAVVLPYGNSFISDKIQSYSGVANDNTEVTITLDEAIDPALAEIKVSGGGGFQDIQDGTGQGFWGDWTLSYVSSTQVKIKLNQLESVDTFPYAVQVIERKAQTVFPIIDSIAATAVVIDWAKVPSVAADIALIVVEYI